MFVEIDQGFLVKASKAGLLVEVDVVFIDAVGALDELIDFEMGSCSAIRIAKETFNFVL
jgi:hypothetical protein